MYKGIAGSEGIGIGNVVIIRCPHSKDVWRFRGI